MAAILAFAAGATAEPESPADAAQVYAGFKAARSREALRNYRVKFVESYGNPARPTRRISLECEFRVSGEKFIHETKTLIDAASGKKSTFERESWDGKHCVRLAWPDESIKKKAEEDAQGKEKEEEKEGRRLRRFTALFGETRRGGNELESLLDAIGYFRDADRLEPAGYEPAERALTLRWPDGETLRIWLADTKTGEFSKIESIDKNGKSFRERIATEWRTFGGIALPTTVVDRLRNENGGWLEKTFRVLEFENDVADLKTDFVAEIKDLERWAIQDDRKRPPAIFPATRLDAELMKQKRYGEALDAAFAAREEARKRAEREREPLSLNPPRP